MDRIPSFRDHHHVSARSLSCLAAFVSWAWACAACFSPDIADGVVPCGVNGECPSGFECRAGVSRCFKKGTSGPTADASESTIDAPIIADALILPDVAVGDALPELDSSPPVDAPRADAGPMGTVSFNFMGDGGGTVTANTMPCTSDCSLSFPIGTVVNVTQLAQGNSVFGGWGGGCTGLDACQVTIDATPKMVDVTFTQSSQQLRLQVVTTGPGTVAVTPPGSSCGPGCYTIGKGTPVTLTPTATGGFSFQGWTGGGCEVVGVMPCLFALNSNVTVTARFCDYHHVADATSGMDTNAGTCAAPFKTVTKALSVAVTDERILVRPGKYDTTTGEVFPISVPDKVLLVGDEPAKGNGTVAVRLEGGGPVPGEPALRATVVLGAGSVLAGFLVVDPPLTPAQGEHGVVITKPTGAIGATVRNNTIAMGGGDGIYVNKGQNALIVGNVVSNQDRGTGIRVTDGGAGAKLESNVVLSNQYGVEINAVADLGSPPGGSAGGNVFSCNDQNDLIVAGQTPLTVQAQNNSWDHMPPSVGCAATTDLCQQNATVTVTGAALAPNSCP